MGTCPDPAIVGALPLWYMTCLPWPWDPALWTVGRHGSQSHYARHSLVKQTWVYKVKSKSFMNILLWLYYEALRRPYLFQSTGLIHYKNLTHVLETTSNCAPSFLEREILLWVYFKSPINYLPSSLYRTHPMWKPFTHTLCINKLWLSNMRFIYCYDST